MDTKILDDIYRYWFGELSGPDDYPTEKSEIWFKQSDENDGYIRETFGWAIPEAAKVDWDLAPLARQQQVALVVLLDQFPRNIFRTSGEAFTYDAKARAIARKLIDSGRDRFFWTEKLFVYLPFQHSEDVADQDLSVFLSAEAALAAPDALKETFREILDYATKHRDLVRKFGRFPHRNAMLGRASTPEEEKFLAEHGRGY